MNHRSQIQFNTNMYDWQALLPRTQLAHLLNPNLWNYHLLKFVWNHRPFNECRECKPQHTHRILVYGIFTLHLAWIYGKCKDLAWIYCIYGKCKEIIPYMDPMGNIATDDGWLKNDSFLLGFGLFSGASC